MNSKREAEVIPVDPFEETYHTLVRGNRKAERNFETFLEYKKVRPPKRLPRGMKEHKWEGKLKWISECHLDDDICLLFTDKDHIVTLFIVIRHDDAKPAKQKKLAAYLKKFRNQ